MKQNLFPQEIRRAAEKDALWLYTENRLSAARQAHAAGDA